MDEGNFTCENFYPTTISGYAEYGIHCRWCVLYSRLELFVVRQQEGGHISQITFLVIACGH